MPYMTPGGGVLRGDIALIESRRLRPALRTSIYAEYVSDPNWWQTAKRVLIMRNRGLGDVLMVTAIIRHLHGLGIIVDMATESQYFCLFEQNPYVTDILDIETVDATKWIWSVDFREYVEHPGNQHQHRVTAFAEGCHIKLDSIYLDYFLSPEEMTQSAALPKDIVGYVWQSTTDNRNWDLETHKAVISGLLDRGLHVALLHHIPVKCGVAHARLMDFSGKLDIRGTATMLHASRVVVSPDTGLFHLASALKKPILSYFGAFPLEDRQTSSWVEPVNEPNKMECYPCRTYRCPYQAGTTHCAPCLKTDVPRLVQKAVDIVAMEM